jgi:hypothetical protein
LQLSAQGEAVLSQRVTELREARERLEAPLAFLRALPLHPELGLTGAASLDLSSAVDAVDKGRKLIEANPDAALKGTAIAPVLGALRQAALGAEAAATGAWRQVASTVARTTRAELLDVLGQVPSYRQGADRLRAIDMQVRRMSALRWPTPAELAQFLDLRRQAEEEWGQLGGSEAVPPAVMEFLTSCARDGAALDDVTPEISEWISQRGLREVFRIRFAGG